MTAYNLDPGAAQERRQRIASYKTARAKRAKRAQVIKKAQALERKAYLMKLQRMQEQEELLQ